MSKEGRRPFLQSVPKVKLDTTSSSPSTFSRDRFIFPFSSVNIRSACTFSAINSAWASVSPWMTPRKTTSPLPMRLVSRWSIVISARLTRCITARIARLLFRFLYILTHFSEKVNGFGEKGESCCGGGGLETCAFRQLPASFFIGMPKRNLAQPSFFLLQWAI